MEDSTLSLWQAYQDTQFLLTQRLSVDYSFVIITAHNPLGQIMTSSQNRLLDKKLQNAIDELAVPYRALIGAAADKAHMEKSWAVMLGKHDGIKLGLKFNQNAIYFVDGGYLYLIPCHLQMPEVAVGEFASRIELVNELPEVLE